jgi:hypothetical protein
VNIAKKAVGLFAVTGLVASGFAFAASTAGATQLSVGSCSGQKLIGTAKSTVIGQGLTDNDNQDASIGFKGVDPAVNKGTNLGGCAFNSGLSTPDNGKPVVKGFNGLRGIVKSGIKLFSPEADCDTTDTGDNTEWPLNGSLSLTFGGALTNTGKAQALTAAVIVDGFKDPVPPATQSDVVTGHGIVTKGVATGADMTTETYFNPVFKDKTQTTAVPYFGYNFDLGPAIGCTTATKGDANIIGLIIADGTSPLTGMTAAGVAFTIGQP